MRVPEQTLISADYDDLSRLAVRVGALRWPGASGAVAVLAGAMALLVLVVVPSNLRASPLPIQMASVTVGLLFTAAGLVGVARRPQSPVGPLLVLVGLLYLVGRLQGADPPLVGLGATLANSTWQGVIFYITYSFPNGRLRSPVDVVLVFGGLGYTAINNLFVLSTSPTRVAPGLSADNAWYLGLPEPTVEIVRPLLLIAGYALILGGTLWLTRRWLGASAPLRRVLTPVYVPALATGLTAVLLRATFGIVSPTTDTTQFISIALLVTYGLLPVGFLIGLLRAQIARAAVADLVIELADLPTPSRLQNALAAALHDPTLEVITWSGERNAFVDTDGRIAQVPNTDADRSVTVLERDGNPSAILIHDPALLDDPGLVAAVGTAVRLTLENEMLEIEVGRQLDEVRASRGRVAAAADDARRKIERDIHDGTQQRLLGIAIGLQGIRSRLDGSSAEAAHLEKITEQLNAALAELRELARGVHPAVLSEHGLSAALRALARRSSIPVDLDAEDLDGTRLPDAIEAAVYFIASAALSNAEAHSAASNVAIRVQRHAGSIHLTVQDDGVGGAVEGRGTGLTGMRDRAATVGGQLSVESPRGGPTHISAVIPLEAAHAGS